MFFSFVNCIRLIKGVPGRRSCVHFCSGDQVPVDLQDSVSSSILLSCQKYEKNVPDLGTFIGAVPADGSCALLAGGRRKHTMCFYTNANVGTTRSWPTPSRMCFTYDVTSAKPETIAPVTGRFSGEPRSTIGMDL